MCLSFDTAPQIIFVRHFRLSITNAVTTSFLFILIQRPCPLHTLHPLYGHTMNRTPDQESAFQDVKACIELPALNRLPLR